MRAATVRERGRAEGEPAIAPPRSRSAVGDPRHLTVAARNMRWPCWPIVAPSGSRLTCSGESLPFLRAIPAFGVRGPRGLRLEGVSLKLSKRTEYGVRAMVQLARQTPRSYIQSQQLATLEGKLPNKFLESILLALRRGGFLESKIGREGGYRLSRAARDIRVGEVIRRLEGRLSINDAPSHDGSSPGELAIHLLNEQLTKATDDVLDQMTLEQLVEHVGRAGGASQQMYYI